MNCDDSMIATPIDSDRLTFFMVGSTSESRRKLLYKIRSLLCRCGAGKWNVAGEEWSWMVLDGPGWSWDSSCLKHATETLPPQYITWSLTAMNDMHCMQDIVCNATGPPN